VAVDVAAAVAGVISVGHGHADEHDYRLIKSEKISLPAQRWGWTSDVHPAESKHWRKSPVVPGTGVITLG
jgi:hypothetical protein